MINLIALVGCAAVVAVSKVKLTRERKIFEALKSKLQTQAPARHVPKDFN